MNQKLNNFNIVRSRGQLNRARLPDGTWVERQDKLWVDEYRTFIKVMYDDVHFIYQIPDHMIAKGYKGPIYKCTCGAAAIVVGMSGYVFGASPQGLVFTCQLLTEFQRHSDIGTKWI